MRLMVAFLLTIAATCSTASANLPDFEQAVINEMNNELKHARTIGDLIAFDAADDRVQFLGLEQYPPETPVQEASIAGKIGSAFIIGFVGVIGGCMINVEGCFLAFEAVFNLI